MDTDDKFYRLFTSPVTGRTWLTELLSFLFVLINTQWGSGLRTPLIINYQVTVESENRDKYFVTKITVLRETKLQNWDPKLEALTVEN